MAEAGSPMVMSGDRTVYQLRQITVESDDEIEQVNRLLADGWRLMNIGFQTGGTIYVLGRADEKPRHRPGFLGAE
jgi:hypothetical protein